MPTTDLHLPVLPTTDGVVFPDMVVTVTLASDEAKQLLRLLNSENSSENNSENNRENNSENNGEGAEPVRILLVPRTEGRFASVGVVATVEDRSTNRDGSPSVTLRAERRARVGNGVVGQTDGLWVEANPTPSPEPDAETHDLAVAYRAVAVTLINKVGGRRMTALLPPADEPETLADSIAYWPDLSLDQRIELLETIDVKERLRLATEWAKTALSEIEITQKIQKDVTDDLDKTQRQAILRRQLAAIQSELAEVDGSEGSSDDIGQYRAKLAELSEGGHITEKVATSVGKELDRLERSGGESMESSWIRTWLETVFDLPWAERSTEQLDLDAARSILDADHTGLDEVKDRLIEHLAVRKLRAEKAAESNEPGGSENEDEANNSSRRRCRTGAILALVGPPGVGKTSLGESVADALGRSFVRLALGGIRDEAEIRGHRRTYVGARPGRLVAALKEAGTMNPVILLDEVDKISGGWQGDPSAALLEVLDPAQNHSFRDHYLEFELDLSDVVFIATANVLDTIPGPLLDRMEIIGIEGYAVAEKTTIARDHLLERLVVNNGLTPGDIRIDDDVLTTIAADYTREAGVRRLERQVDKVIRKTATSIAIGELKPPTTITIGDLGELLGKPIPREQVVDRIDRPGIATGLAVTGAGGDVLFVETALVDAPSGSAAEPILTGQLGDVMKESATIVRSLVAGRTEFPADKRIHVHFPAGAVPKDGPSAGVTMTTALTSLLTGRRVRSDVAMTGEVSLSGRVLPIGGVKQKVLAAHRAGITTVLLPADNGRDLDDVPDDILAAITIHLVADIDEVLELALEG